MYVVTLARKPVESSIVSNVLEHGAGAVHIAPCRVGGRWPANLLYVHRPGCRLVGEERVPGHRGYPHGPGGTWRHDYQAANQGGIMFTGVRTVLDNAPWVGPADADGMESVQVWECVPGCGASSVRRYFRQVGG